MSEPPLFLDTSALLRAYLTREPLSAFVLEKMRAAPLVIVSLLAHPEVTSALTQRQHRDHSARLSTAQVSTLLADFEHDWETLAVVELTQAVTRRASLLVREYPEVGLRALDALHLACALEAREVYGSLSFLTFDARQSQVAEALGFERPAPPSV
ncbi:type II toxin-antitoxin system VapC family toxin [Deinococcus aluminii]|uniref:Ribonuclease VapC n=1 Tax=Deinococcus aluminii TaxID=1656885 RepID=A0ABP9XHQ5_9DEIO